MKTKHIKIHQCKEKNKVHFLVIFGEKFFLVIIQLVKSICTTNTDFSKRCRYEDEVMV
jgi:hypothetical protein